ncbi:profilin [Entomortierella parvispora]|uniref:Profilin n=1 Tax=Entomortierella parvispora TaxID=205924 RepID=A0A9P3LS64_9FUNG|nr:profilin [Entomortierella parvispora]
MSWQSYVDNNLVATGKVTKGAIFGLDGSTWGISPDFQFAPEEIKKLVASFSNSDEAAAQGIYIGGKKFVFLRDDPGRSVYARLGATGIACAMTGQTVIVGFYDESIGSGDCTVIVEGLADYLRSVGY